MNRFVARAGVIGFACLLMSCGGGGGGGGGGSPSSDSSVRLSANAYAGSFVGNCFPIAEGTNYETGAALFMKTVLTVGASGSASAALTFRLDFFDNASCTGHAVGTLSNNNASNTLTLASATTIGGRTAHRVILSFGNSGASYQAGPTASTVIYGTALRLKLPSRLLTGFTARDLWSLDNNDLYEGNYTYDTNGFPTGLLASPVDTKVTIVPAASEAPCAAQTLNWSASGNSCVGLTTPSRSQISQQLASTPSTGTIGDATFTCTNGAWSAPANTACRPDVPAVTSCSVQTITWSSGANTCSGLTSVTPAGNDFQVVNATTGNDGGQYVTCQADGTWTVRVGLPSRCDVTPAPITDPLQLAQVKNCIVCHSVTGPGYSSAGSGYTYASFQSIANYYRASPPAAGVLESKIKAGSSGTFGTVYMPANPQVSDADLAILVPWILSQ